MIHIEEDDSMKRTAKVFTTGRSQAVRLPAEFRFNSKEVYIRKNPETGEVILSSKPEDWSGFFSALKQANVPENFLSPEERDQGEHERDPFEGYEE